MARMGSLRPPPTILDATSTIGGSVGRKVLTGYGGTAPIVAHGAGIPADLYGLHQEELARQPVPILGAGLVPRADYGVRTPVDLEGLRADLLKRLNAPIPRGVG
jgi:hypothetical protein